MKTKTNLKAGCGCDGSLVNISGNNIAVAVGSVVIQKQ
jgi:hypothetical protein